MSPMRRLFMVLLAFLAMGTVSVRAQNSVVTFKLNTSVTEPYTTPAHDGFLDRLMAEAFRRLGHKAEITVYEASERALINANRGLDDGALPRIKGLEAQYENLLRVPEKVMDTEFVGYTLGAPFATDGWESLRSRQLAYILGWKIFENNLDASYPAVRVRDPQQLFGMLRLGRAEVVLYERWQGLAQAKAENLRVHVLEPPLARSEQFLYLHRRHAHLVDRLAAVLAEMKRDGTYRRLHDATVKHLAGGR